MKTWQKRIVAIVGVLALAFCVTPWLTRNQTTTAATALDYVNPVVRPQTVYVATATESVQWRANNHGGLDYCYHVTSYDADGRARKLLLTASDEPLAADQYLAVSTKGQVVLGWHRVAAAQVPPSALHQLLK